jgi:hypothetical protein
MNTIEDAWRWYQGVRDSLTRLRRLGAKHWETLPREGAFGRDSTIRQLEGDRVAGDAETGLQGLDDFAVFVLFSVFEAQVRDRVLADTLDERRAVSHPSLGYWMRQAEQSLSEGSFFRVLEGFKSAELNDLIEQVNQVRRYRNWVAHGRRDDPQAEVSPEVAYQRLQAFLDALPPPPVPVE